MQPTSASARVIPFGPKRRAARANGRRRAAARAIVSIWLGVAALALVLLVGQGAVLLLRHGPVGLGIGLGIVTLAGWPFAGRLIRPGSAESHKRPISRRTGQGGLKLSLPTAEATEREH